MLIARILAMMIACASSVDAQTFARAMLDSSAGLRITTSTGQTIVPEKDSGQVGFAAPAISADHRRVGWLALYPNCCTSYPIPLKLVVRTAGKERVIDGAALPVWRWVFVDGGRRVAIRQTPVHGDAPAHYELRDADSGKLVEAYDALWGAPADSIKSRHVPRWVRIVDEAKPPI